MSWAVLLLLILIIVRHRYYWKAKETDLFKGSLIPLMSHRGYKKKHPENTLSAFKESIKFGFLWIEMDLVSTKDNVVVCSHNFDLETETDGRGYFHEISYRDLSYLRTGINSHTDNTKSIPSLIDVLGKVGNQVNFNFEVKTSHLFDLKTVKGLVGILKNKKSRFFMISSFSPLVIGYLKCFYPSIVTAFLVESERFLWMTNWLHPNFLNVRADMLSEKLKLYSEKHNCGLIVWTVNNRKAIKFCEVFGVKSIITDLKL